MKTKKLLSLAMALIFMLAFVPVKTTLAAGDIIISGTNGIVTQANVLTALNAAGLDEESNFTATFASDVIRISSDAFSNRKLLTVTIPDTVTTIDNNAFSGRSTNIIVSASNPNYSDIDGVLFNKDQTALIRYPEGKSLNSGTYNIPNTVTLIAPSAFRNCTIGTITMPDSVTSIGAEAFYHCYVIDITLSSNITSIPSTAFYNCNRLKDITIPARVTTIASLAFSSCNTLDSVTILGSITIIGFDAFKNCKALDVMTVWNQVSASITDFSNLFQGNTSITSLTIPPNVTSIDKNAFKNCKSLELVLPNSITYFGGTPFDGCASVSGTVELGKVTYQSSSFNKCTGITFLIDNDKDYKFIIGKKLNFKFINGYNGLIGLDYDPSQFEEECCIDYATATDILVYLDGRNEGPSFNLTRETVDLTGLEFTHFDFGKGWTKATSTDKNKALTSANLSKALDKGLRLRFKNSNDVIVEFPRFERRPKAPKGLQINYKLFEDATGEAPGEWVLTVKNGTEAIKKDIQIGALKPKAKAPPTGGWGRFMENGGVHVRPLLSNGKPDKAVYQYRYEADPLTLTPASKSKKITAKGLQKAPKYKIVNGKNLLKYKADTYMSINGGTPVLLNTKGELTTTPGTAYTFWLAAPATGKKPASAKLSLSA